MSRENVQRALAVMDTLGRRDAEALIALADPDVEWHSFFALGQESRIDTETPAGWTLKFRGEKLLRFRAFREPERALEAVGV